MSAKDNTVFAASSLYKSNYPESSPEQVIYGYLKLLSMNDFSIKVLLSDDEIKELDAIRSYVSEKKLDLSLILVGLSFFEVQLEKIKSPEDRKQYDLFLKFLEQCTSRTPSVEIFAHAVDTTIIPICRICTTGNTTESVMKFLSVYRDERKQILQTEKQEIKKTTDHEDEVEEYSDCDFDLSIRSDIKGFIESTFDNPFIGFRELDLIRIMIEYTLDFCKKDEWTWDHIVQLLKKAYRKYDPLLDSNELDYLFERDGRRLNKSYFAEYREIVSELDHSYLNTCIDRAVRLLSVKETPEKDKAKSRSLEPLEKECRRFLEEWNVDRIIAYLDRKMTGQAEGKEKVAELCYEHVFRIANPESGFKKSCYVLFGPTGSGKTESIRQIREILPVPVEIIDTSLITSEGFKGQNISNVMKEVAKTSTWIHGGIIVFDEFDKICIPRHSSDGDDVNKEIQGQFLKIIEGESRSFNTEKVTFICAGAFDGAFSDYGKTKDKKQFQSNINKGISECLIDFGMIPEIAGRVNTIIPFEKLSIEDYKGILKLNSGMFNAIRTFYKKAYHVDISFSEEAVDRLCLLAAVNNLGARGLETIIRVVFAQYRKEAKGQTLFITAEQVDKAYFGVSSDKTKYSRDGGRNMVLIQQNNSLTLDSIAGLEEEKEELREIIDFLKNPDKYTEAGARLPKGVLFIGPPGTGKTMLAKAIAGEANVPFYSMSGSDFISKYAGEGIEMVKSLFRQAKSNAPSILFIDEIDAIAKSRSIDSGDSGVLNQILVEMDGFNSNCGMMVIAATNLGDAVDPAIKRAGRFDRKVYIRKPDVSEREAILKIHAENKKLSKQVDLHEVAQMTIGFSGAELESLLNEAAIDSVKAGRKCISKGDIHEEFIRMCFGTEKKLRQIPENEKKCTAYHEAGHAIMMHLLPHMAEPQIVSIIPTGRAAGYVFHSIEEGLNTTTREYMLEQIKVSLAGRIAEEMYSGDITAGAYSDIKNATGIAKEMVMVYGMSKDLGPVSFENGFSEMTGQSIDHAVSQIINECYEDAKSIIEDHKDVLTKCVELLLEKERITGQELLDLFQKDKKGKKGE